MNAGLMEVSADVPLLLAKKDVAEWFRTRGESTQNVVPITNQYPTYDSYPFIVIWDVGMIL